MSASQLSDELSEEADAFNQRITDRTSHGFIPDLRRAVNCDYFYKSFFRDPYFMDLYLGDTIRRYVRQLNTTVKPGARVLDAGCGPGHFALELARSGYHVLGIDIADKAIATAREVASTNPFTDGFGSLEYRVAPLHEVDGRFDAILFSGVLHHLPDFGSALDRAAALLVDGGVILGQEPSHELWRVDDAAQVALIRGLLSLTGHWYEPPGSGEHLREAGALKEYVNDVLTEYRLERDKSEAGGQSPNDLSASGSEIFAVIRRKFDMIEEGVVSSFIHRTLGGLRGPDEVIHPIADFLTVYEKVGMDYGFMRPQALHFLARKRAA